MKRMYTDFRERNAAVAIRWSELPDEERKQWAKKAETVCSSSVQVSWVTTLVIKHIIIIL